MTNQEQIIDQINTKTDRIKAQLIAIRHGVDKVSVTWPGVGDLGYIEEQLGYLVNFLNSNKGA